MTLGLSQIHLRRGGVAACLAAASLSLGACASREAATTPWSGHFEAAGDLEPAPAAPVGRVELLSSPHEALESDPELPGYEVLGRAEFRDERADESPLAPGSPLERFAREIGADMVRLGVKPAGTERRTRYARARSVTTPPPTSPVGAPRTAGESERVPVEVEVEVFDHLAVFYRRE